MSLDKARADAAECARLEGAILTPKHRAYLDAEKARWDLDPPQREEYATPLDYVLALERYADACMSSTRR